MINTIKTLQTMQLASEPGSINIVEGIIEELKDDLNIAEESFGNILVAVTEAVNNAIYHGNKADPGKKINVSYECRDERIMFCIKDEGCGFDYYNIPDPTKPENLDKPNGRGIFLMKQLTDQLIFSENGKQIELQFKLI